MYSVIDARFGVSVTLCYLALAGAFDEKYLMGLDFVIAEVGKRGMKILPVLTNYWPDYGGMIQYAK